MGGMHGGQQRENNEPSAESVVVDLLELCHMVKVLCFYMPFWFFFVNTVSWFLLSLFDGCRVRLTLGVCLVRWDAMMRPRTESLQRKVHVHRSARFRNSVRNGGRKCHKTDSAVH